ncbi:urease accessory protein UreF [Nocardioides guangzhouensis]|uniref:Urease accessory protein UreF n=1 Tax=Nocardioides guangzhouensis TaxID=2497878 RepID=A0A4Q4Z6Y3_9ACTN|nr:urease accessory UreF family protein [Nocardioides guangzhouensis]RYP83590.1 urease accessory protein UreF [Nocardioides guangzhouensis]
MNETWLLNLLAERRTRRDTDTELAEMSSTVHACRVRLLTVTTVEAATAVVALNAVTSGVDRFPVADAWKVRTPDPYTRMLSREEGRSLLARAAESYPELVAEVRPCPVPVAVGIIAATMGLGAEDVARIVGYDDMRMMLSDHNPADAHVWMQLLLPDIKAMGRQVAHLDDPMRIPATGAALLGAFAS